MQFFCFHTSSSSDSIRIIGQLFWYATCHLLYPLLYCKYRTLACPSIMKGVRQHEKKFTLASSAIGFVSMTILLVKWVFIMPHRICGMKKTLLSSPHLIVMQKIPIINWIMFTSTTRVRITELTLSSFKLLKNNFSRIALSCLGLQVVFYCSLVDSARK